MAAVAFADLLILFYAGRTLLLRLIPWHSCSLPGARPALSTLLNLFGIVCHAYDSCVG
jgi:hypothetical protein